MTTLLERVSDPRLTARRLLVLVEHHDVAVRSAVASNPSTPPGALLRLLAEFPGQVLDNPGLLLHRLADPALFAHADPGLQADWARLPDLPSWLLTELSNSDDSSVRAGVAGHANTPVEVVERLAFPADFEDDEAEPCADAMYHPGLPPGLLFDVAVAFASEVDRDYGDIPPAHVAELLLSPRSAGDDFEDTVEECELDSLWNVALSLDDDGAVSDEEGWSSLTYRDPESGSHVLVDSHNECCSGWSAPDEDDEDDEARDERLAPRAAIAGDEVASIWGSSPEELACHRDAPWHLVRRSWSRSDAALEDALGRDDVPVEQLAWLARDTTAIVRRGVAAHPSTPARVLATLAQDPEPMIRLLAARHAATPAESLARLASDDSATIRRAVAGHPATPERVRPALASDRRASVREAIAAANEAGAA